MTVEGESKTPKNLADLKCDGIKRRPAMGCTANFSRFIKTNPAVSELPFPTGGDTILPVPPAEAITSIQLSAIVPRVQRSPAAVAACRRSPLCPLRRPESGLSRRLTS